MSATASGSFAVVRTPGGVDPALEVRNAATGAAIAHLGPLGPTWTNNGFAFSPDERSVYVTLIGRRTLQIERIDARSGSRSIIADGEEPALSVDGRDLAYAAGGPTAKALVVRDLVSGRERRIDLAPLLGRSYELLNSSIVWTRDGSRVLVEAPHVAIADARELRSAPRVGFSRPSSCTAVQAPARVIEVRASASQPLHATRLGIPITNRGIANLQADGARPTAVFVLSAIAFGSSLDQVDLTRQGVHATRVLSLAGALLVAVDPTGSRVMYLTEGRRPALWRARIHNGRLSHRRPLIPNVWLQALSW